VAKQVREVVYPDPVTGADTEVIDIGSHARRAAGHGRVGMNKAVIMAAATRSGNYLLLVFAGAPCSPALAGVVFVAAHPAVARRRRRPGASARESHGTGAE